jgi:endogenous inhibitor of DNA gyrase (YacG/DUF329 family)
MTTTKACPRCGARLVRRTRSSDGEPFLGCSRYPGCQHTEEIPLDQQLWAAGAPELPLFDEVPAAAPPAPEPPSARSPRPPTRFPVPDKDESRCASCGAAIIWTTNPMKGTRIPLSVATIMTDVLGQRVAASHFTDCPHAKGWTKRGKQ